MKYFQQHHITQQQNYQLIESNGPAKPTSEKVSPTYKTVKATGIGIQLSEKLTKPMVHSTTAAGVMFKQVFSGKTAAAANVAYPVARHASILNGMLPSQKKLKISNNHLQSSITSSMLVRQNEPKTIAKPQKLVTQRVKVSEETHIIKPSSISFIDQPTTLGGGGIHRHKKSDGDNSLIQQHKPILQVRSKGTFQTETKQEHIRNESRHDPQQIVMVVADDSYFRIQTRQPSASKL